MPRVSPSIQSFNAGEWSPLLEGRTDINKYGASCRTMQNFIAEVQGAATKRPGFIYGGATKDNGAATLIPWSFNREQSYQIVAGDQYFRFINETGYITTDFPQLADPDISSGNWSTVINAGAPTLVLSQVTPDEYIMTYTVAGFESIQRETSISLPATGDYDIEVEAKLNSGTATQSVLRFQDASDSTIWGTVSLTSVGASYSTFSGTFTATDTDAKLLFLFGSASSGEIEVRNLVLKQNGETILEVTTPWNNKETAELQWAQSGDVMYLAHPNYAPRKLTRIATENWTLEEMNFQGGPYLPENVDESLTITSSGVTGSVTLSSTAAVFDPSMVGALFRFRSIPETEYDLWESGTSYTAGDRVWSESYETAGRVNVYQAVNTASSGTRAPGHDSGTESDGAVDWLFVHSDSGAVRLTAVNSTISADGTVEGDQLPTSTTSGTFRWSEGAWSNFRGFPRCVSFYENRLFWAYTDTQPQTFWGSKTDAYETYSPGFSLDNDAVNYTLATESINAISFLSAGRQLIIGTEGAEFVASGGGENDAITPTNIKVNRESQYGSKTQMAESVANATLFVQRNETSLMELTFDLLEASGRARDLAIFSEHLTQGLQRLSFQSEPDRTVWTHNEDGTLLAIAYEREQEVNGWTQHTVNGVVESVSVIPSADGNTDRVWTIVRRTINGVVTRYVEYSSQKDDLFFVDSGIIYNGVATTVVTGLDHLEGETVSILADYAVVPNQVVTGGKITLETEASIVHVGYGYTATLAPQRIEGGAANGTSQGKSKRIHNVTLRLFRTGPGLLIGSALDDNHYMDVVPLRNTDDLMDTPVPLKTGDTDAIPIDNSYDDEGLMVVQHNTPLPCTIVALYPQMVTYDQR